MIWQNDNSNTDIATDAMTEYIQREINADGTTPATPQSAERRQAAANAVAAFLRHNGNKPVVATEYLVMLTARALWAVGEKKVAGDMIRNAGRRMGFSPQYATAAFTDSVALADWKHFFSSRAVRPVVFSSLGDETLWILDVCKLLPIRRPCLEMTVLSTLNKTLERLADIWDATSGQGLLGLRGLRKTAGSILAMPTRSRAAGRLADEIKQHCLAQLQALSAAKKWRAVPVLVNLDGDNFT